MLPSIIGDNLPGFFEGFFDDFFDFPAYENQELRKARKKLYGHHSSRMMKTDVKDHDDHYDVYVDLPGFKKDEISVELNDGYLTVSAEKALNEDVKDENGEKYIRKERFSGSMSRSFYVGDDMKQEDIHAKYENGVLSLEVPKINPKKEEVEEKKYIAIEG